MRKKLIEAIFNLSGDEIETVQDAKDLALLNEEELVDRLIAIAEFYREEYY
jgi:hypothetical protein